MDCWGPYPGRGPWRHLPPWERPGYMFRGWCWRHWGHPYLTESEALKDYREWLERYVKALEEEIAAVKEEIKRVEDRLKELEKTGKS